VVGHKIADTDILPVASVIRETNCVLFQNAHEAFGPASVLNVWPARLADACHVKAIALANEPGLVRSEHMVAHCFAGSHAGVAAAAAEQLLHMLHGRRECDLCELVDHETLATPNRRALMLVGSGVVPVRCHPAQTAAFL